MTVMICAMLLVREEDKLIVLVGDDISVVTGELIAVLEKTDDKGGVSDRHCIARLFDGDTTIAFDDYVSGLRLLIWVKAGWK